jgi:pyruvate kinase
MDRIVRAAEAERRLTAVRPATDNHREAIPEAMCGAAAAVAETTNAAAVAVMTESGMTARLLSKYQPGTPIVAFTPHEAVRRRMALYWGVTPQTLAWHHNSDEQVTELERSLKSHGIVVAGDRIVLLAGTVAGRPGGTNIMKLHAVQ